jgi:oxysterol-binding protein-related protein 9/10/11
LDADPRPIFVLQNEQRQRRRDEAAAGKTWPLKHFVYMENDPTCEFHFRQSAHATDVLICG